MLATPDGGAAAQDGAKQHPARAQPVTVTAHTRRIGVAVDGLGRHPDTLTPTPDISVSTATHQPRRSPP